jgi:hypothetical protein
MIESGPAGPGSSRVRENPFPAPTAPVAFSGPNFAHVQRRLEIEKPLKVFRKTSASLLDKHSEFGRYDQFFLGHAGRSIAERHYVVPSQEQFGRAVEWLGKEYGFLVSKIHARLPVALDRPRHRSSEVRREGSGLLSRTHRNPTLGLESQEGCVPRLDAPEMGGCRRAPLAPCRARSARARLTGTDRP